MAKYQLTEEEKQKEQKEAEEWAENVEGGNVDADYWDKLLRHHYEQHVEEESGKMGKGTFISQLWYSILGLFHWTFLCTAIDTVNTPNNIS